MRVGEGEATRPAVVGRRGERAAFAVAGREGVTGTVGCAQPDRDAKCRRECKNHRVSNPGERTNERTADRESNQAEIAALRLLCSGRRPVTDLLIRPIVWA